MIELQSKIIKKSYLPENIHLTIKNIDFNEKKRENLKLFIQSKNKFVDAPSFIDNITSGNCEVLIPKNVTCCYYSLPKGHPKCEAFFFQKKTYTNY